MKNKFKYATGFTLVELMVTLVVAAILLTVAAPSFIDMIRANRLATQTNLFTTALNLARSEAIKRNKRVVVCKASGSACDTSVNWENGFVVFEDLNSDGDIDAGEETIRVFEGLANGFTLRVGGNLTNWVGYIPSGRSVASGGLANDTFRLCASDAATTADTNRSRSIALNATGRILLSEGTGSCP